MKLMNQILFSVRKNIIRIYYEPKKKIVVHAKQLST